MFTTVCSCVKLKRLVLSYNLSVVVAVTFIINHTSGLHKIGVDHETI